MHVLAPRPSQAQLPLFFNVDTIVGDGGQNSSREDILLVQFLMRAIVTTNPSSSPAGEVLRQRMLRMQIDGSVGPTTIDAIRAWQEGRKKLSSGTIVDGRVSPAHGYFYGPGEWTIVDLNTLFRIGPGKSIWPRLQDHPLCPAALKSRVPQVL